MKYALFLLATGVSHVAIAQSNPTSTEATRLAEETAALNAQAARDNAAAAATNAATAKVKAQTDALGIPKVEGKTTLGTNAGALESWILSSYAVDASGLEIATNVAEALKSWQSAAKPVADGSKDAGPSPGRILLLAGEEPLTLDTAANVRGQIGLVQRDLDLAVCPGGPSPLAATAGAALPWIGAVANLLRTDTEVTGLDVAIQPRMLAAATGKHLRYSKFSVVIPAAAIAASQTGETAKVWKQLLKTRDSKRKCEALQTPDDKLSEPVKRKVKALREAIGAADSLESKLLKADEKGNTLLGQAVRVDALLEGQPYVLRVSVEKGGGSFLKRSNLWTTLGAPAVAITGGLISNYWLTDPRTGELITSGNVVCRTAMTNLRDVQTAKVKLPDSKSLCKSTF